MLVKNNTQAMMEADCLPGDKKMEGGDEEKHEKEAAPLQAGESKLRDKQTTGGGHQDVEPEPQPNDATVDSDSETAADGKKKKRRRRRHKGGKNHRRWKPYDKMSWQEKRALEEKETRRANQKREDAFASGHPVAPYNTTQFLMEDHIQNEAISPDLHRHNSKDSNGSNCTDSSSEYYEDESENDGFIAKNFCDTYDNFHAERLSTMPKEELIRDFLEMEAKVERLENNIELKSRSSKDSSDGNSLSSGSDENTEGKTLQTLVEENKQLKEENDKLRQELKSLINS